jgi:uncharacterized protein (DUF1778 family)
MPAPKGNRYNAKDSPAESYLHLRVRTADKAMWVKAAQREGLTLSQWVIGRLSASPAAAALESGDYLGR